MNIPAALLMCVVMFLGGWLIVLRIALDSVKDQLYAANSALADEAQRREGIRSSLQKRVENWRDFAFRQIDNIERYAERNRKLEAALHGTEEALHFNVSEVIRLTAELEKAKEKSLPYVVESVREVKKLKRLFERMPTYNNNRHGPHDCCPCVRGIEDEYVKPVLEQSML